MEHKEESIYINTNTFSKASFNYEKQYHTLPRP